MGVGRGEPPMLVKRARGTEFVAMQLATDMVAVLAGLLVAYWFRFHAGLIPPSGEWDVLNYVREVPWATGLWMIALHLTHNYQSHPQVITFNRARRLLMGSGLAVALVVAKNYFMRDPNLARLMYPIMLVTVTSALIVGRAILQRLIVAFFVGKGLPRARVLIVGLGPTTFRIAARIKMHPEYAMELVGFVNGDPAKVGRRIGGVPVLGMIENLRTLLREHRVQDVFIAQGDLPHDQIERLFMESEMEGARVQIIPTLTEMLRTTIYYDELVGVPLYRIRESPLQGINLIAKRAMDVGVSLTGLMLLAPMMALIALLVKRASPGPVFYRQERLGFDGQQFDILKFRTMPVGTEKDAPVWGDSIDPRAGGLGNFLRKWNLDELPQLWNVLRGEMSLVGPRPERPFYVEKFREAIPHYMARHKVLTGMTGWAQVHGLRGNTSIAQRLRYDLYYIENWSLWLDIKILLMTFFRPSRRIRVRHGVAMLAAKRHSSEGTEKPSADHMAKNVAEHPLHETPKYHV